MCLNEKQKLAFEKLKNILVSEDVMFLYPDYPKFVLSQNKNSITMISRTLRESEINCTTNERELLAIVWALKTLRNYLFCVKNLNIYTDHQLLTFAVSDKNPNAKIKRWKSFIDEHNANIFFKPGKENIVADALSRQNALEKDAPSDMATLHSEL